MRYSEEITAYIYRQMSPLKREAFELRLEKDPELAAEVREQQEMLEAVRSARIYEEAMNDPHLEEADRIAKEILEARKKKSRTTGKTLLRISLRIMASAASFALIFLFGRFEGNLFSSDGIIKKARKQLGFRTGLTRNFGRNIGIRLARFLSRIRKR